MALCLATGLIATVPLFAQLELHGHVYPLARLTFENRYLNLPHRIVSLEGHHRGRKVSLFFNTTLEYRLGTNTAELELQEAYAEFSTGLGVFCLGQQVITWGAADGNNPTDNVSPYDFYYLFLPGTDRKQGNLAAAANLYLGNVNVEAVVTPVFQPNRLPLNEPDFPIMPDAPFQLDMDKECRPTCDLENTEFGLRARLPMNLMDVSLSYFRGFDRMFTPTFYELIPGVPNLDSLKSLEYYQTQVIGGDVVTFLGDWAIRAEGAFFLTRDDKGKDPYIRNPYLQYVLQLDRADDRSNVVVQYLGTIITKIDEDDFYIHLPDTSIFIATEEDNEWDNLPPRMGMPFAAIAQNAFIATVSYDFANGRYSLQANALYDLDHDGYMVGGKATLNLEEAFDLELGVVYLNGSKESRLHTIGEVFSHLYVGMKYSF